MADLITRNLGEQPKVTTQVEGVTPKRCTKSSLEQLVNFDRELGKGTYGRVYGVSMKDQSGYPLAVKQEKYSTKQREQAL